MRTIARPRGRLRKITVEVMAAIVRWITFLVRTDYNRMHIINVFEDKWPTVRLLDHHTYIQGTSRVINALRNTMRGEKLMETVIKETRQCNFVVFKTEEEPIFLQLWRGDGDIELNYPMWPKNRLGKYQYRILALLKKLRFEKTENHTRPLKPYTYKTEGGKRGKKTLVANFGWDTKRATKFIVQAMEKIFLKKLNEITVQMG